MTSLLPDQLANTEVSAKVIGWTKGNVLCVLAIVEEWVSRISSAANSTGASEVLPPHEDPTLMLQMVVDGQNNDLSTGLTVLSGQYPFGPIQMLGPLEELLRSAERLVRFHPPDAARLQYLTSGTTSAEENCTGSVDSAGVSVLAKSIAAQDGYGIAATLPAESQMEIMLDMINATRSAQRDIANLRPIRRYRLPIPASISTTTIVASQRLGLYLQLVLGYTLAIMNTLLQMPARLGVRSHTAAQLSLRLEQIRRAPSDFGETLHRSGVGLEERSRAYMKFWNTVWLVLNDLLIGFTISSLISLNTDFIANHLRAAMEVAFVRWPLDALTWLDDWPVGLKLNTPLSHFYRTTMSAGITYWAENAIPHISTHMPIILSLLCTISLLGATSTLSLLQDLLRLTTLQLHIAHCLTRVIWTWLLDSLGGLWNLFRGKRWNVLRQRTDAYQYDVDQLFLGTLAFVVGTFLAPTVLVYAALFFFIEQAITTAEGGLRIAQTALNAFPLFELLLRVKEPSRLPAGIYFEVHTPRGTGVSSLRIRNAPKSFASILFDRQSQRTKERT